MDSENLIEVKHVKNKRGGESLILFYNGKNTNVGWKQITIDGMEQMIHECQIDFPMLDMYEEFATLTMDLLHQNAPFLEPDETKEATKLFMGYFKSTIKR